MQKCLWESPSLVTNASSYFCAQLRQRTFLHHLLPDLCFHTHTTKPMLLFCNQTLGSHLAGCLCSNNSAGACITEVQKSLQCCTG